MNHLKEIGNKLAQYQLDAMVLTSRPGEFYAVGFYGEGTVVVAADSCRYFTDARYIEAAEKQVSGAEITMTTREKSHMALLRQAVDELGIRRLGFEDGYTTVAAYERLSQLPCQLTPAQALVDELRASKDQEELAAMVQAQRITDEAFSAILTFIRPGMTEREVAARLQYEMLRRGAERMSFDPIVAAGANGSMPHAVPGDTVIGPGMFVTMDFGCVWGGYCSDMTRTVAVGHPDEEMRRVYQAVLSAQKAGIRAARAGITGQELDQSARQVLDEAGYGPWFSHSLGHSLGLEIHEAPNAAYSNVSPLPVGAVLSVEPGVYLPGRFGVRIEDVVALREDGCQVLTQSPKELIVL